MAERLIRLSGLWLQRFRGRSETSWRRATIVRLAVASGVGALTLSAVGTAFAALGTPTTPKAGKPKAGATYKGEINGFSSYPISFKVSRDGASVTDVRIPQPLQLSCLSGKAGPGQKSASTPASIDRSNDTFTADVTYPGEAGLTVTVTGQFLAHHAEQGAATFTYVVSSSTASEFDCTAPYTQSGQYTTKAKKHH
jgi:hypothetical protein